jgi:hypothetical protein
MNQKDILTFNSVGSLSLEKLHKFLEPVTSLLGKIFA